MGKIIRRRWLSIHYVVYTELVISAPFTTVGTNLWTNKNLHGYTGPAELDKFLNG